jgi:hypothetical protein
MSAAAREWRQRNLDRALSVPGIAAGKQEEDEPSEMSGKDNERPSEQRKQPRKWPPYDEGARIISYNVNEDGRPFGVKIRFKIRIVTGKEAAALDKLQADAIREYLRWVRQYRQSRNSGPAGTSSRAREQRRSG